MSDITFRKLSSSDADSVACLHIAAFKTSIASLLGIPYLTKHYRSYLSYCSISLGVFHKDRLIGFIALSDPRSPCSSRLDFNLLLYSLIFSFIPSLILHPIRAISTFVYLPISLIHKFQPFKSFSNCFTSLSLDYIAVSPSFQSSGLGKQLLHRAFKLVSINSFDSVSTRSHNMRLISYYQTYYPTYIIKRTSFLSLTINSVVISLTGFLS